MEQYYDNGITSLYCTMNYSDMDGDIKTICILIGENPIEIPISNSIEQKEGKLTFYVQITTSNKGEFPFAVLVKDKKENTSNILNGSVIIE